MIGVPLILITTANLGKFLSSAVNWLYLKYLDAENRFHVWARKKIFRGKVDPCVDMDDDEEAADFVWQNLEISHYVKVPVSWLLLIVVAYACTGGYLFR